MAAFFSILETFLKSAFSYRQQILIRFFLYLHNRSKTRYFHRRLQFWEEEKVSGDQVRWIWRLRHEYGFVFGQKLTHKHRCESWCIIMLQNPWLVFRRFCAFLMNCAEHNFNVLGPPSNVFSIGTYFVNGNTVSHFFLIEIEDTEIQ